MTVQTSQKTIVSPSIPDKKTQSRKRVFDVVLSGVGLVLFSPLFMVCFFLVFLTSPGPVLFRQERMGMNGIPFNIYKFRTIRTDCEGLLITPENDTRITKTGRFLRKTKLDELPQLWNVLKGDMSLVGPRPEVREYVRLYSEEEKRVLQVRPGITGLASVHFLNESEILAQSEDPNETYIKKIMPEKLRLDLEYIPRMSLGYDLRLIAETLVKCLRSLL